MVNIVILLTMFTSSIGRHGHRFTSLHVVNTAHNVLGTVVLGRSTVVNLVNNMVNINTTDLIVFPFDSLVNGRLRLPCLRTDPITIVKFVTIAIIYSAVVNVVNSLTAV